VSGCPTAAMVVIGNEILSGKVRDSNSPFLASQLRELGVSLERMVTIPDDVEIIARTVREYSEAWDHVFTSRASRRLSASASSATRCSKT
jgi:molybdopterin-biosynthesis enzyme MoeA-like protein